MLVQKAKESQSDTGAFGVLIRETEGGERVWKVGMRSALPDLQEGRRKVLLNDTMVYGGLVLVGERQ